MWLTDLLGSFTWTYDEIAISAILGDTAPICCILHIKPAPCQPVIGSPSGPIQGQGHVSSSIQTVQQLLEKRQNVLL